MSQLLSAHTVKATTIGGAVSIARDISQSDHTITVSADIYTSIAVIIALIGVLLARLVTISDENKRLGRVQSLRETGPLTWIGALIVGPLVWHFQIAIPWASLLGLGAGYSVRMLLKLFGAGVLGGAKAMVRNIGASLEDEQQGVGAALRQMNPVDDNVPAEHQHLLNQMTGIDNGHQSNSQSGSNP